MIGLCAKIEFFGKFGLFVDYRRNFSCKGGRNGHFWKAGDMGPLLVEKKHICSVEFFELRPSETGTTPEMSLFSSFDGGYHISQGG